MRCGYGLAALPGTDARFFSPETSFLRLPRTVHPARIKFGSLKIRAKIDEARKEVSFYELLGISETGTLLEIKQAYKQLARKYHPDVSPPDRVEENTERFIRVQEAYETLSDPRRRAVYDKDLAFGLHLAFSGRRRYQHDEDLEDRRVEKPMGISAIGAEEKKHEQGCRREHVMGSSNAQAKGRIV
ncbi:Chaperone protein dnaJ 20 [Hibiscus syriacus]|uniref:Chaperone protein dnaJ 20 n=1 Tax=Hibiscus syriacus TaxID=106335 RepID=A0A6A3CXQ2_HIBSY|nr:chaperone protein dnaJ 20, chloroplastic-like [Hibiscus syriacus]KAE8734100.1 Chaperone protein dnaJ 20 [Hibiscus syriacus]